ncbi:MAG: histone deacetylase family protein [Planctomycetota bacterium]
MSDSAVTLISHPSFAEHDMGPHHPERPARIAAVRAGLETAGLWARLRSVEAPSVSQEQLLRVHAPQYLAELLGAAPTHGLHWLDEDTALGPRSLTAAIHAAGAVVHAVDLVMSGQARAVFCSVRPPGHHAERRRAMGFCFFDNVAVGAAHALAAHGLSRVAIIDFDVHHGNGTEDIFAADPRVLVCSSFQHPLYPGTGHDTQSSHILNLPLPAGTDGPEYRARVAAAWLPALDAFRPELVMFSAGFDAHVEDPLAQLALREDDFRWITEVMLDVAERHAGGRVVSTLEGGYSLAALGRSAAAHVAALVDRFS